MTKGLRGYKAYLPYINPMTARNNIEEVLKAENMPLELFEKWNEYGHHACNFSAYHLVRILSQPFKECVNLINSTAGQLRYSHMIIATPKDPDKLRVFINMPLDFCDWHSDFMSASPYTKPEMISTLIRGIDEDMKHAQRKMGWTPLSRARTKLKKYEDMSVERALLKYTNVGQLLNESAIKNIAAKIVLARKPVVIQFAKTPAEIAKMYKSGPSSCMTTHGERAWKLLTDTGSHPCAFFSYHPYVRGAYILNNRGGVRARVFLYTKEDGKEYYGKLYGSTPNDVEVLRAGLHELGIMVLPKTKSGVNQRDGSGHYWRDVTMTIPGIAMDTDYIMPFPYLDNFKGLPEITFDTNEKVFKVQCHAEDARGSLEVLSKSFPGYEASQSGFISSKGLFKFTCASCGNPVNTTAGTGRFAERETGHRYCTNRCMERAGKIIAKNGEGNPFVVDRASAFRDDFTEEWYTNLQALIECGGGLYQHDVFTISEEDEYTTAGIQDMYTKHFRWSEKQSPHRSFIAPHNDFGTRFTITKLPNIDIDFDVLPAYKVIAGEEPGEVGIGTFIPHKVSGHVGYMAFDNVFHGRTIEVRNEGSLVRDIYGAVYVLEDVMAHDTEPAPMLAA
jgi:hypothetical protein